MDIGILGFDMFTEYGEGDKGEVQEASCLHVCRAPTPKTPGDCLVLCQIWSSCTTPWTLATATWLWASLLGANSRRSTLWRT